MIAIASGHTSGVLLCQACMKACTGHFDLSRSSLRAKCRHTCMIICVVTLEYITMHSESAMPSRIIRNIQRKSRTSSATNQGNLESP